MEQETGDCHAQNTAATIRHGMPGVHVRTTVRHAIPQLQQALDRYVVTHTGCCCKLAKALQHPEACSGPAALTVASMHSIAAAGESQSAMFLSQYVALMPSLASADRTGADNAADAVMCFPLAMRFVHHHDDHLHNSQAPRTILSF